MTIACTKMFDTWEENCGVDMDVDEDEEYIQLESRNEREDGLLFTAFELYPAVEALTSDDGVV